MKRLAVPLELSRSKEMDVPGSKFRSHSEIILQRHIGQRNFITEGLMHRLEHFFKET